MTDDERPLTVLGPHYFVSDDKGLRLFEKHHICGCVERWTRDSCSFIPCDSPWLECDFHGQGRRSRE